MMFSNKPEAAAPLKTKRRSIIGTLYNPRLGDSVRPIGNTFNVFVRLLAIVFAMNGLFPKDHPSLKGEDKFPYTLSDILGEAWAGLSFTKEGIPKIVLFFAVISAILCAGLSILCALFIGFLGHAHAQAYFTPPSTGTDIGYNIIDYLFSPANTAGAYSNLNTDYNQLACGVGRTCTGVTSLPNNNIQAAVWLALGIYSNALLVFGGIILFYHLMSMVVDTAHSGVVMGRRASQVWAPIRLAIAVILLVPVSSGLNSGQMLVMQLAQWGSGLATNVWNGYKLQVGVNTGKIALPDTPDITNVALNIIRMGACEYAFNKTQYDSMLSDGSLYDQNRFIVGWQNTWPTDPWNYPGVPVIPGAVGGAYAAAPIVETTADSTIYHFQAIAQNQGQTDLCGSYTIKVFPDATNSYVDPLQLQVAQAMWNAQNNALTNALPGLMAYASNIQYMFDDNPGAGLEGDITLNAGASTLDLLIANYQNDLNTQVATASSIAFGGTDPYAVYGWVSAAAFFNRISNVQQVAQTASTGYLPITKSPSYSTDETGQFEQYLQTSYVTQSVASLPPMVPGSGGGCPAVSIADLGKALGKDIVDKFNGNIWNTILLIVNDLGQQTGVWCSNGSLGVHFTGADPLAQIAAWGDHNISMGMSLLNLGTLLYVAGDVSRTSSLGRAVVFAMSIGAAVGGLWEKFKDSIGFKKTEAQEKIGNTLLADATVGIIATVCGSCAVVLGQCLLPFAVLFISLGFLFGAFLPLLPFLHFFLGVVTWIGILFEAVFAMPLVAIAHINPNGDGLPGDHARDAYFMAFSILLRPTLMVFGLIAGFICLMLATSIINMFLAASFIGGGSSDGHAVLLKIMYTVIYVSVIVSVANHAFHLITTIPNQIMGWIGAKGVSGQSMGDVNSIESRGTAATALVTNKIAGAVPAMARNSGAAVAKTQSAVGSLMSGGSAASQNAAASTKMIQGMSSSGGG